MDLKSIENGFYNQNLSIKKRFLISNTLFKKELKKIKNKLIKERIKIDSLRYITLIEYQNIHTYLKPYRNRNQRFSFFLKENLQRQSKKLVVHHSENNQSYKKNQFLV